MKVKSRVKKDLPLTTFNESQSDSGTAQSGTDESTSQSVLQASSSYSHTDGGIKGNMGLHGDRTTEHSSSWASELTGSDSDVKNLKSTHSDSFHLDIITDKCFANQQLQIKQRTDSLFLCFLIKQFNFSQNAAVAASEDEAEIITSVLWVTELQTRMPLSQHSEDSKEEACWEIPSAGRAGSCQAAQEEGGGSRWHSGKVEHFPGEKGDLCSYRTDWSQRRSPDDEPYGSTSSCVLWWGTLNIGTEPNSWRSDNIWLHPEDI